MSLAAAAADTAVVADDAGEVDGEEVTLQNENWKLAQKMTSDMVIPRVWVFGWREQKCAL